VSNSESFIDEVSDAVRRDQLFQYFRRYGWIAVVAILLLVGGAAYREYVKARDLAVAEARGDAIMAALTEPDEAARKAALAALPTDGAAAGVSALLAASDQQSAGETEAAAATLDALAANQEVPEVYRQIAVLKAAMLRASSQSPDERIAALTPLAVPGAPFGLLAQEQIALATLAKGDREATLAILNTIVSDASVTRGLRDRAQGLIVALGGELPQTSAMPLQTDPAVTEQ
jgi:hypothetical protein